MSILYIEHVYWGFLGIIIYVLKTCIVFLKKKDRLSYIQPIRQAMVVLIEIFRDISFNKTVFER